MRNKISFMAEIWNMMSNKTRYAVFDTYKDCFVGLGFGDFVRKVIQFDKDSSVG